MRNNKPLTSACCGAEMRVDTADEGTSCYICCKCGKGTDPKDSVEKPECEHDFGLLTACSKCGMLPEDEYIPIDDETRDRLFKGVMKRLEKPEAEAEAVETKPAEVGVDVEVRLLGFKVPKQFISGNLVEWINSMQEAIQTERWEKEKLIKQNQELLERVQMAEDRLESANYYIDSGLYQSESFVEGFVEGLEKRIASQQAEITRLQEQNNDLKKSEKELSDAYLRIRELVGAWDTNHGGENRFELTEKKIADLQERLEQSGKLLKIIVDRKILRHAVVQDGKHEDNCLLCAIADLEKLRAK